MRRLSAFFALSLLLGSTFPTWGYAERRFQSGPQKTSLVELYTSEGCSSCPPAEEWLSGLRDNANLWRTFVPIAFHVIYWDSLGWKDTFASKKYTERQYAYASAWSSPSVYTPCFVNDGREWQRRGSSFESDQNAPQVGTLTLSSPDDLEWQVAFSPTSSAPSGPFDVVFAQLGGEISVAVHAGENAGHTLRHDFVAFELVTLPLETGSDRRYSAKAKLVRPAPAGTGRRALAAWIVRQGELSPLQATGGWIDKQP